MSRKIRLEYPGGVYHLIQRGNNRRYIFESVEDKRYLLEQIFEYKEIMKFDIFGYVLMGNHYHLIVRAHEIPISEIMQRINNNFSRYYNRKYFRTGHVFENRYKGILVVGDQYLLSLLRYVHQNPVSANMCSFAFEYKWSSDRDYRENNPELIDIDFILNIFSENRSRAIKNYIEFMDENRKENIETFEGGDIIGDFSLLDIEKYNTIERKSLESILEETIECKEDCKLIKSGSRKRYLTRYKKEFIGKALKENYTFRKIGSYMSITHVAVYSIYSK